MPLSKTLVDQNARSRRSSRLTLVRFAAQHLRIAANAMRSSVFGAEVNGRARLTDTATAGPPPTKHDEATDGTFANWRSSWYN